MREAKARHSQVNNQAAVQRAKGVTNERPHGERVAQPEAVEDKGRHAVAQNKTRALIESSSPMAAQRETIDGIQSSPLMNAQRKQLANHAGETVQRRELKDASSFDGLGLRDTGETFSVVGQYGKGDALWYADKVSHEADTKSEALGKIAARAGDVGKGTQAVGGEEVGKRACSTEPGPIKKSIFTDPRYYNDNRINAIDPFTHGSFCQIGDSDYIVTMYQHTHDLDGYVSGIEEGTIGDGGTFARSFAANMMYGRSKATASVADTDNVYSNEHDKTGSNALLGIAESSGRGKSDAITKLAGEGARFEWVQRNIATITDNTIFQADAVDRKPRISIQFKNLWCVWKGWFGGAYNIDDATIGDKINEKGHAAPPSREAKKRLLFDGSPYS
ncbi:hypothetical protein ACFL2V_07940 [Pseudomonadota bacterium]